MKKVDVSTIDIRDYAQSFGYTLVKEAIKDGLFVLNSPDNDYKQLIIPTEPINDSDEMSYTAISKLSEKLSQSYFKTLEEIREVNDDVISLRYYSDIKIVNSLSFHEALESIEATKQMILSAGSSAVNPVLYHQRLSRSEAVELLKKTKFRHTEEGSFILKVSCPIQLESAPVPTLFGIENENTPISRKAFEIINESAIKLLSTIKLDNFDELFEEQQKLEKPLISYNLCDSLVKLFDDERELPFELKFGWSRGYIHKLGLPQIPNTINFPYSYKSKLEELKSYFIPEKNDTIDTFFGSVESLNGNEGNDGRRLGEVNLSLLIDNEAVKCRAILNTNDYQTAYKAHGQGGGMIKVKGKLVIKTRSKNLEEITFFELISK